MYWCGSAMKVWVSKLCVGVDLTSMNDMALSQIYHVGRGGIVERIGSNTFIFFV